MAVTRSREETNYAIHTAHRTSPPATVKGERHGSAGSPLLLGGRTGTPSGSVASRFRSKRSEDPRARAVVTLLQRLYNGDTHGNGLRVPVKTAHQSEQTRGNARVLRLVGSRNSLYWASPVGGIWGTSHARRRSKNASPWSMRYLCRLLRRSAASSARAPKSACSSHTLNESCLLRVVVSGEM